jgi:hypothetical protein
LYGLPRLDFRRANAGYASGITCMAGATDATYRKAATGAMKATARMSDSSHWESAPAFHSVRNGSF